MSGPETLYDGVESQTVRTDRLDTRYLESGEGTGTPVVFLHGTTCDSRFWEGTLQALPDHYRGIAPDRRGCGRSATKPVDATAGMGDFASDVHSLLDVQNLSAGYGDIQILDSVDVTVGEGEYVTLVGPNGAGKSTVMKSVLGHTIHMGGQIYFDGTDITHNQPEESIHLGLSYVPQTDKVFPSLTVEENLKMGAYILDGVPQDRLRAIYERFPILEEREGQKAAHLSGGQRQMLAMGRALMLDPELFLLDEPSAGLAPDLVADMFDRIDDINDDGTAVLMIEQNATKALKQCDRGYVLVQGQNRFEDTGQALLEDEQIRREFLGG